MSLPEPLAQNTFVIRFWWEVGDESGRRTKRWHARVEHLQSGDGRSFQEVAQMLEFMRRFVAPLELPTPANTLSNDH